MKLFIIGALAGITATILVLHLMQVNPKVYTFSNDCIVSDVDPGQFQVFCN